LSGGFRLGSARLGSAKRRRRLMLTRVDGVLPSKAVLVAPGTTVSCTRY